MIEINIFVLYGEIKNFSFLIYKSENELFFFKFIVYKSLLIHKLAFILPGNISTWVI